MVIGHHSFVAVAFAHSVFCYRFVHLAKVSRHSKVVLIQLFHVSHTVGKLVSSPVSWLVGPIIKSISRPGLFSRFSPPIFASWLFAHEKVISALFV